MTNRADQSETFVAAHVCTHPQAMAAVRTAGVGSDAFADPAAHGVMRVVADLFDQGNLSSHQVVRAELKERGLWKELGGEAWWSSFTSTGWGEGDLGYHLDRVEMAHIARQRLQETEAAHDALTDAQESLQGRIDAHDGHIDQMLSIRAGGIKTVRHPGDMADELLHALEHGAEVYEPTGFMRFDTKFGGLPQSRLTVVAARTNHGKSAWTDQLMLNVARRYAKQDGKDVPSQQVIKFDLENSALDNQLRLTANLAEVPITDLKRHVAGREDLVGPYRERVIDAAAQLRELPLTVDVQNSADVGYVRARIMAENARREVGLVVIDYAGQMSAGGTDRTEQLMGAVKGLHVLAGDLEIPIVLISQINREPARSSNGHPQLHHLSYSDDLAKKPAMVVGLFNPLVHWDQTGRAGPTPDPEGFKVFVLKNKGPGGMIPMHFKRKFLRFTDPGEASHNGTPQAAHTRQATTADTPF